MEFNDLGNVIDFVRGKGIISKVVVAEKAIFTKGKELIALVGEPLESAPNELSRFRDWTQVKELMSKLEVELELVEKKLTSVNGWVSIYKPSKEFTIRYITSTDSIPTKNVIQGEGVVHVRIVPLQFEITDDKIIMYKPTYGCIKENYSHVDMDKEKAREFYNKHGRVRVL